MMAKNGLHKGMIAKKFHEKRSDVSFFILSSARKREFQFEEPRRKKRSAQFKPNPYLQGEPLHSVSKKDGRYL